MKQSLLLLGGVVFSSFSAMAQSTPVSQTAANKNALLEELTGIHCGYCPDGHKRANDIAAANPGRVVLVNIHAGGYATPSGSEPDLRTADGTSLDGFFAPTGYPAGTVQRKPYAAETILATSRANWSTQVNSTLAEASPVNIAMDATIDAATRQLTLHVEMFYTATQTAGTTHYLNIGMLQNDFEGPQTNYGNYNPTAILPNGNYLHQHIFRGFINTGGTWGEAIDATQGGVITRTVTMTLPASINTTALNIGKLQFFAVLHEGHNQLNNSKVLTAAEISPTYTNVPGPTASLTGIVNTFNVCDGESITPVVKVENSGDAISSINFTTSVNGGTAVPYTYTGAIAQFGSAEITLPAMVVNAQGTNSVVVNVVSVNNGTGTVGSVATQTKSITIAANAPSTALTIKMTCDRYGSESSWKLFNSNNVVVASAGPFTDATATGAYPQPDVVVTVANNDCYHAVVYDSYGDGFDSGYGNGDFKIISSGVTSATIATFSNDEQMDAMYVQESLGLNEATSEIAMSVYPNPASTSVNVKFEGQGGEYAVVITDLAGRTVATTSVANANGEQTVNMPIEQLSAGNYLISIVKDGSTFTQKLSVK